MKKIFLLILVLLSIACYSQNRLTINFSGIGVSNFYFITPPGYTKVNQRLEYTAFMADSGLHVPTYSSAPYTRSGVWVGAGNIGVDSVANVFYFSSGGIFRALGASQWVTTGSDIYYNSGGVAIGATSVNSKAALDIPSTTKGILIPRMNTTQQNTISTPPTGLLIYNIDSSAFRYFNGAAWVTVGTGTGGGGGGTDNANVGSFFRILKPVTQEVKTLANGVGILIDSTSNTNALTIKVDSTVIPTHHYIDSVKYTVGSTNPEQRHSVVSDTLAYSAFPSVAFDPSNINLVELVYKESGNHAADGPLMWSYSTDGFTTFPTPDTLTVNGSNKSGSVVMEGKGSGTRWVLAYGQNGDYDTIFFAKKDDNTNAFTSAGLVDTNGTKYSWFFPFGKTIVMPSGELRMPGYGQEKDTTVGRTSIMYFKSTNNGDSWSFGGTIIHGGEITIANGQKFPIAPSEADWQIISTDGTNAGTKIILICRDDANLGNHIQVYTDNGGTSWTNLLQTQNRFAFGSINANATVADGWPCLLMKIGIKLYAVMGVRNTLVNGGYSFRVFSANASSVYNNTNLWVTFTTPYRALDFYKESDLEWGYGWPFPRPDNQLKAVFYDISSSDAPTITTKKAVIKTLSLLGNNYYEAYNDANQSITNNTETTVTFPKPWLDDQNYYNSDSSKIYIQQEGWYTFQVKFQLDTSALGTYRLAKLYAVDWGSSYGVTPQYAKYEISRKIIQPSTVNDFCWIELTGQMYCWQGMEIRATIKQDTGGGLNIINSVTNAGTDGARIKIKKIN